MLNNENYKEKLRDDGFALILVGGNGCANCTTMYPVVKRVSERICNLSLYNLDVDEHNCKINEHYQVDAVPTLLLLYNGVLISKMRGYQPEEILEIYLDTKIEEYKSENHLIN